MPRPFLDVDTMIPLGLIINELITNALKYAFPGGMEGTLTVSMKKADNGSAGYELVVRDTGIGLPEDFDIKHMTSLGLEILQMLVGQIKGTLQISGDDGTEFRIGFTEDLRTSMMIRPFR